MASKTLYCALLVSVVCINSIHLSNGNLVKSDPDWWKTAVFYQIYPRSFMDSDNDGIGDLKGVIERMDHLVDLGVTALWLSPIFKSPMKDMGYDISDFRNIDPSFGTLADFDELIQQSKLRDLRVVLDFVPNHSSDEHVWFQKSIGNDPEYADYYVWRQGKENNTQPPNNWISHFHGPAWTYNKQRDLWYLHQYHSGQPDLNFRNAKVQQEMNDVLTFWLDRGVDGFRVDTVPSLVETSSFPDEKPSGDPNCGENDRCFLEGVHQSDQPETFQIVYDWRQLLDDYETANGGDTRVMMTESYSAMEQVIAYYGDGTRNGAHFSFNFFFITKLHRTSTAHDIDAVIKLWLNSLPKEYTSNWVLGNHDQHRLASRYGVERSDGLIMLQMALPGVAVTYNGEEIAMENGEVTWEQGTDPQACQGNKEDFQKNSRDLERTPMHWNAGINAGFNAGHETWLPVSEKHLTNNVDLQKSEESSHYKLYTSLLQLRQSDVLRKGDWSSEALNEHVLKVLRKYNNESMMLLMNISDMEQQVDLTGMDLPKLMVVKAASTNSKLKSGSLLTPFIVLKPYETIIVTF